MLRPATLQPLLRRTLPTAAVARPQFLRTITAGSVKIPEPIHATPPPTYSSSTTPHETLSLLPLLRTQPSHYITIHIHKFPFLVTPGDRIQLPFLLKDAKVGDVLRLTHASVIGSRDYTLKGSPFIDPNLFECRATVVEETAEPMRVKVKTKRRQRKTKKVHSKHKYTVLRVSELLIKEAPEA